MNSDADQMHIVDKKKLCPQKLSKDNGRSDWRGNAGQETGSSPT